MKFCLIFLLIFCAADASASVPDIWCEWDWPHTEPVQLMVSPAGTGPDFSNAAHFGGAPADATIHLQVWYQDGFEPAAPLVGYPGEDIWLWAPGLAPCLGATRADTDTDGEGWTAFSLPPSCGGWTDPDLQLPAWQVYFAGTELVDEDGALVAPAIAVNSPDINGDGFVDLADLGLFATDFYGDYSFRSDFFWDGTLNLADVGRLATSYGAQCP